MSDTWLILDSDYLCHRARYALGGLQWDGEPTAILYGFLRDVIVLTKRFQTLRIVFAFDHGRSIREKEYPSYKSGRRNGYASTEDEHLSFEMKSQIHLLRDEYLPKIGFKNVLYQHGYEADDVIASVSLHLPKKDMAVIISSDQDMYQLLSERVSYYNPHKKDHITIKSFSKQFGIAPDQWVDVKAIAGCKSDTVEGIKGIGEKTALKFLKRELKESSKKYQSIAQGTAVWKRNYPIVKLPYPGTEVFKLVDDEVNSKEWNNLCSQFGMESLQGLAPVVRK